MGVIRVSQNSFNAGEVSPLLYACVEQERYKNSCMELCNMLIYPQGTTYRRPGLEYMGSIASRSRIISFVYNSEQSYILEFSEYSMRIWYKGALVCNKYAEPIVVQSPFLFSVLDSIQFVQTSNVMYFASLKMRPYKLERIRNDEWKFSPVLFGATLAPPVNINATGGIETEGVNEVYICSVDAQNRESIESARYTMTRSALFSHAVTYTWDSVPEAEKYHVYIRLAGEDMFSLRGVVRNNSFKDYAQYPDIAYDLGSNRGPNNGAGSYPCTVQFWQQRLVYAGSLAEPQTLWFSKVGEYEQMQPSSPIKDDDAIIATISSETVQPISWLYAHREMIFIGTGTGEWSLSSSTNGAITPATLSIRRHTAHGTCSIPPARIGDAMIFVQRDKKVVRQLQYIMENDSFIGNDLTIFAEHILKNTRIRAWTWQQYPNTVLWIVLEDGTMAGLTFVQEYGVFAWHKHTTQGFVESITSIPAKEENEVYIIVRRKRGDQEYRTIERFYSAEVTPVLEEAKYLDSSKYYSGEAITKVEGLEHLEGENVDILGDGMVQRSQIVQNGMVQLEYPVSTVCVGLGYISSLIPISKYLPEAEGRIVEGRAYTMLNARIHTISSPVFFVSNAIDKELYPSSFVNAMQDEYKEYSSIHIHTVSLPAQKSRKHAIRILQNMPLPMTILAVTVDIVYT